MGERPLTEPMPEYANIRAGVPRHSLWATP